VGDAVGDDVGAADGDGPGDAEGTGEGEAVAVGVGVGVCTPPNESSAFFTFNRPFEATLPCNPATKSVCPAIAPLICAIVLFGDAPHKRAATPAT